MEEIFKAARTAMRNQMAQTQEASELDKEGLALAEKMMENAFKKDATISEDMGQEVLGYISKAASTKKRGASSKPDPTPALSGPNAGKGNTQTPENKSALDILTGHTSKASNVIKKVLVPGNMEGIRKANQDGFQLSESEINAKFKQAADQAKITAEDPAVKEKFRQLGIPEETFTSLTGKLTSGVANIASSNPGAAIVTAQKQMSEKQMSSLENPFGSLQSKINVPSLNVNAGDPLAPGSDLLKKMQAKTGLSTSALSEKNPFGSMGVDFGNIQGAITSKVQGLGVPKDLGVNVPVVQGAGNIKAAGFNDISEVPDIVNKGGFTNLSETVRKTESVPDTVVASTPVEEIGVPQDRPVTTLVYTTAHTAEEIELELGSTRRQIDLIVVGWTRNAIDEREKSAKAFNESIQELRKEHFGNGTEQENSSGTHYIILRDGTIQRILNTEVPALARSKEANKHVDVVNDAYKSSIVIRFDAGYTCTAAEKNFKFISVKSISNEQFESYKLFVEACTRALPGTGHISFSDFISFTARIAGVNTTLTRNSFIYGPGFDAAKYALNFNAGVENPLEGTGPNSVNILNFLTGGGG